MTTLTVIAIISVEIGGQALGLPPLKPILEISRKVFEWAESKKTWLEVANRNTVTESNQSVTVDTGESTNLSFLRFKFPMAVYRRLCLAPHAGIP